MGRAREPNRPIRVDGDLAYVPLTRGVEAIIDIADLPLVRDRNWYALASGDLTYACCKEHGPNRERRTIRMHRVVAGAPDNLLVDHRDGDGLNNRRGNVRVATHSDNMKNRRVSRISTTGFKGVSTTPAGRFVASIERDGVAHNLGVYATAEEAGQAYAMAAIMLNGDFAPTDDRFSWSRNGLVMKARGLVSRYMAMNGEQREST